MARQPLFAGLIYDENGRPVASGAVGPDATYIVDDAGFQRHVDAESVDRQVLAVFVEQLQANKDLAVAQALRMMGQEDPFSKAALDKMVDNVDMDEILARGIPEQARNMMGMMGFRIIINYHGEFVRMEQPGGPIDE